MRGPGIFLAQFSGEQAPFNSLRSIAAWAGALGYRGVQIPTWDRRLFDLELAASSATYCDEVRGILAKTRAPRINVPPSGAAPTQNKARRAQASFEVVMAEAPCVSA